jgi:tol-pal system protein YbgF
MAQTNGAMERPMITSFSFLSLFRHAAMLFLLAGAAWALSAPAHAQNSSDDTRALLDRVDRLQREMTTLQRQVYQGGSAPSSGSTGAAPTGNVATSLEIRIQDLEEQLQNLRGQIEEANYHNKSVADRLDKLSSDVDYRLGAIEKKVGVSSGTTNDQQTSDTAAPVLTPPARSTSAGNGGARVLGQLPADGSSGPATINTPPPPSAPLAKNAQPQQQAALPPGAPKDQYAYAFSLLNQNDYAGGERALKEFIAQHPKDPLAGDAQYWLGRTYYARNNFNEAVRAFAEGYQKYPQAQKAPDNLLYLGRSLAGLNQKSNACQALSRMLSEYPKASEATKSSAQAERKKLACS